MTEPLTILRLNLSIVKVLDLGNADACRKYGIELTSISSKYCWVRADSKGWERLHAACMETIRYPTHRSERESHSALTSWNVIGKHLAQVYEIPF